MKKIIFLVFFDNKKITLIEEINIFYNFFFIMLCFFFLSFDISWYLSHFLLPFFFLKKKTNIDIYFNVLENDFMIWNKFILISMFGSV